MPLHTIEAQLVLECERLGIPAMAGSQVTLKYFSWKKLTSKLSQIVPKEFDAAMASRPRLLVCSVEFLADPEVDRDYPNLSVFQIFPGAERYFEGSAFPCWNASNCLCGRSTSIPLLIQYFGGVLTNKHKVLDPNLGWSDFRSDYGSASWRWLAAATRAR